ncbi:MAG TPA: 16S rRNA (uracil(1498)-N(3))-methyltransferase [Rhodobacteraceae bacterium]|jgi:16S rRNA (uracil1498-N3)-methyltransferase|nr:16S rRNA (uracil(1498)-N(3))-methyltransferase [Paracoccaceae bacterium]HBV53790.1 16S rRNA (uracil(1498)-N(3))-methyltransferase [Paracoccaceae bacterium]
MNDAKIRLHVDQPLGPGQTVNLDRDQAHYLFGVMRLVEGAGVLLFNGRDGEWLARVQDAGKRGGVLIGEAQTKPQGAPPNLWLLFAPVKKARTDFIVEKAVEMGVARLVPVTTEFTNSERVRVDRLQAHAREAAEQCGATWVPEVAEPIRLDRLLAGWDSARTIMYCDEAAPSGMAALRAADLGNSADPAPGAWAILIGPEGGFSNSERTRLRGLDYGCTVSLGPRILRADTAAVAALTLWQVQLGDWR